MLEKNAYQITDWNGKSGERWVANQIRLDAMLEVFGNAAIETAAPAPGEHVLDIGCGAGTSSISLATHVSPQGHVLGVDISEPLLRRAQERIPSDALITFRLADASHVELPEHGFDLLFSRFGVMFFDDPEAAFTHMRRALKQGGRLAFVCWRGASENDWVRLPMGATRDIVPPSPPPNPDAPGPFSFGDRNRIESILTAAGFAEVVIAPFDKLIPFGRGDTREAAIDDALEMTFQVGPLSRLLADQSDDVRAHALAAVRAAFAACPGERSILLDGAAWIVTAQNLVV